MLDIQCSPTKSHSSSEFDYTEDCRIPDQDEGSDEDELQYSIPTLSNRKTIRQSFAKKQVEQAAPVQIASLRPINEEQYQTIFDNTLEFNKQNTLATIDYLHMDQKAEIQAKMNQHTGLFEVKLTDEQYLIGLLSNLELLATKFQII